MASIDMNLVEMDLEAFEIDEALLRELLQEDAKDENGHGNIQCMAESLLEENSADSNMMGREQEQNKEQSCLEKFECHSVHDFEWLNMLDMMEETINPLNDVRMNWLSDDIVGIGMVDFGYANDACYSQICDGFGSNEASYGCLWEDNHI
ncbi:hypothetical protein RJT34_11006 [Clitoria ternatea]|uniref:Uncharacterized protein n=1 Tax=Clitoria ternatea TaxID=43366 RepID=A0AAN9PJM7_CLITE